MNKRHVIRLSADDRMELLAIANQGAAPARAIKRARVLLKADQGPDGPAWTDVRIAEALETSPHTVQGIRKRFKDRGLLGAVYRSKETKPRPRRQRKMDGATEAKLIAIACGSPPEGRAKWSLRLLADKLVELQLVDTVSHDTVWRTLKKTN